MRYKYIFLVACNAPYTGCSTLRLIYKHHSHVFLFFGTMVFAAVVMFSGNAAAAETGAQAAGSSAAGMGYLSAALATGLSCLGGGIAVSAAASAALGAISEDSSILGKSLIFVGLAEGVCLYGLIISFMILGKL